MRVIITEGQHKNLLKEDDFDSTILDDKVGKELWFKYHCWENCDSSDAEIWYRSHQ